MSSLADNVTGASETEVTVTVSPTVIAKIVPPKKGRRPKTKPYFGAVQEEAVRNFLSATTYDQKNKIYNEYLKHPLNKMVESIIRRYKLYRSGMDYDSIHTDTLSFLITKCDKFKPEKGKKAYSYFGTICKNYLMGSIMKDQKERNRKISYEDISSSLENDEERNSYEMFPDKFEVEKLIKKLIEEIKTFMEENKITDNEHKVGVSLIDVFENFEEIFVAGKGNKFNKNIILYELREMTGLTTKEIRMSLKRYKTIYFTIAPLFRNL